MSSRSNDASSYNKKHRKTTISNSDGIQDYDHDIDYLTYASSSINKNYIQEKAISATLLREFRSKNPSLEDFDERIISKTNWIGENLDWNDYISFDSSIVAQFTYANYISNELQQYSIDHAPIKLLSHHKKSQSNTAFYNFSRSKAQAQYMQSDSEMPNNVQKLPAFASIEELSNITDHSANSNKNTNSTANNFKENMSIEDIGDPIAYIHSQVDKYNAQYSEWQKYVRSGSNEYGTWNNSFDGDTSEHGAYGNRWWNSHGMTYDMPHQALHGGVSVFDDESDMPLNSYWHKVTMSPETWSILKTRFRENMQPGSIVWNEVAFSSDWHRRLVDDGWWPKTLQTWFLKNEEEIIHCHDFRCKMMDHSALNEYWRLGELRWNRNQWLPWVRFGQLVVAPILGLIGYYRYVAKQGHPSWKRFQPHIERWKACARTGDWDEYYMFGMTASHGLRPPPIAKKVPTVEYMENIRARTLQAQLSKMGENYSGTSSDSDPY